MYIYFPHRKQIDAECKKREKKKKSFKLELIRKCKMIVETLFLTKIDWILMAAFRNNLY